MTLLVLDTAQGLCTVAVGRAGVLQAARSEPMTRGHQERLPVLVEATLAEAGILPSDLDVVAATRGPGSFTGLRVGLALAQGLAASVGARPLGLSSLDALGMQAHLQAPDSPGPIAAVMDARRGQVYLAVWGAADGDGPVDEALGRPLIRGPEPMPVEQAQAMLRSPGQELRVIGSGAPLMTDVASDGVTVEGPDPAALFALATARLSGPVTVGLEPLYLRAPDATPPTRLPGQPRPDRV